MLMKKIGLICLTLVFALGAMGVGYAMWTDTIEIEGQVNTGTVDIVVEEYSGMWMYKMPGYDPDYLLISPTPPTPTPTPTGTHPAPWIVAYAEAIPAVTGDPPTPVDDKVTVEFDNLFPLINEIGEIIAWEADFECHYIGSIPVKVVLSDIDVTMDPPATPPPTPTPTPIAIEVEATVNYNDGIDEWIPYDNINGIQLHNSDRIRFVIKITIPQYTIEDYLNYEEVNEGYMGLTGSVTGTIQVVQWNEYTPSPTP
jgi:hypothetical protein